MLLSSLLGTPVVAKNGDKMGYVLNVLLTKNRKKPACLICADEDENEYCLPYRALVSLGDAAIISPAPFSSPEGEKSPLGTPVYSESGKALGYVTDVDFQSDGAYLLLSQSETRIPVERARFGQAIILKSEKAAKKKPKKAAAPAPQKARQTKKEPCKTGSLDRLNLLGKRAKTDVYGKDGLPVIRAGQIITPETLSAARLQNKLLELTVSAFTNLAL